VKRVIVESLNLEAQGVARPLDEHGVPGKVVFIDEALPGEDVTFQSYKVKSKFELAKLIHIYKKSPSRVSPRCPSFGVCGGCSMQHLDPRAQLAMKQRVLEDNLKYLARAKPEVMLRPVAGPTWGYRYRGRLSIFKIPKGRVLVGFHQKKGTRITDMLSCDILPTHVSDLLPKWRELIAQLSIPDHLPQLEFAIGEGQLPGALSTVFVLRHMAALSKKDLELLQAFAHENQIELWLQPGDLGTAKPFYPEDSHLCYRLPEFDIEMPFKPTDFTQVNHQINQVLVGRAIRLLDPKADERVLDLFCGIGNFTLPLARLASQVFGIEGSVSLTERAKANAVHNQLGHKVDFACANLFEVDEQVIKSWGKASKWLIDPPRDGAMALVTSLAELAKSSCLDDQAYLPKRIVYVSCNPATLARDVGILVKDTGYRLKSAGVVNMFPHTSHIESIAVFER
jgi:23S rRNA (uracil1939-C5)-methyltransferase